MDQDFSSQLDDWLGATADRYEVWRVLKSSATEITQLVYRRAPDGGEPIGPFVRKIFVGQRGLGSVYQRIMEAQARGVRLAHQPFVYDLEQSGDTFEVVMEYVRGLTLHDLVLRDGPGVDRVQQAMPALCEAVAELHESLGEPIIHRDIKPSNVMVTADRVVLIDLGIARTWHKDAEADTVRYGTPGYAPPEQFGYGQTTVRSDVYALGMTCAFCLTGEDPTAELRERGFCDPRVPARLRPVLLRATQFDPAARHVSARALGLDLGQALSDDRPATTPATPRRISPSVVLGKIWNSLLVLVWLLLTLLCIVAIVTPGEGSTVESYPLWFRVLGYLTLIELPAGAVAYLALDKRRLRAHPPFSGFTWAREFLVCLAIIMGSFFVTLLVYALFVAPYLS